MVLGLGNLLAKWKRYNEYIDDMTPEQRVCCADTWAQSALGDSYFSLPRSCLVENAECPKFHPIERTETIIDTEVSSSNPSADAHDLRLDLELGGKTKTLDTVSSVYPPADTHDLARPAPLELELGGKSMGSTSLPCQWPFVAAAVVVVLLLWWKVIRKGNAGAALLLFTAALVSFIGAWITDQFGWDVYCALAVTVSTCALVVQCHRWSRRGALLLRPPFRLVAIIALATLLEVFGLSTVDRLGGSGFRAAYVVIRYASVGTLCFSWLLGAVLLAPRARIFAIAADMAAAVAVLVAVHAYEGRELDFYEAGIVNVTGYVAAAFALYTTLKAVTTVASLVSAATWSALAAAWIAYHSECDFLLPYCVAAYALVVTAACLWWGLHGVNIVVRALVVLVETAPFAALLFFGSAHPEVILIVFPKPFSPLGILVITLAKEIVRRSYFNKDFNRRAGRWQASVGIVFGGWLLATALFHSCFTISWDAAEELYLNLLDNWSLIGKILAVMVLLVVCSCLTAEPHQDRVGVGLAKYNAAVAVLALIAVASTSACEGTRGTP